MTNPNALNSGTNVQLSGAPTGSASLIQKPRSVGEAAHEFESMALSEFISAMFTTQDKGMFSPGQAGEIYRSLLTQEYGKAFAKAGGIGIAKEVQSELLKMQEVKKQ
ncbi:MAG TPA: rod-binding protein [Alphaproteobacteria bacterium]|nr:rod-binding protein [Alphaproteobacteria bacterium]